ncbi:AraC family transcriptional regulator [Intrasporangium sp.]|uniref:AraC family transcriptional regulator n=1 Tax=Intrasporangium sp. TaxID=1925024 RepID=UPI00293BCA1C|nr:AraC family transcriptional regulator [Intrasporangium sp.]
MRHEHLDVGATRSGADAGWLLLLSGAAELEANRERWVLHTGDGALVDPRTAYRITAVDACDLVLADLRQVVPSPPLPSPWVVKDFAGRHPGVASLLRTCTLGTACGVTSFAASYAGLVGAALTSSWSSDEDGATPLVDAQVADVIAALACRPGEAWTLDRMAGMVHLSRSALTERFRRAVGRSPMQLLRDVRMQHARVLLGERSLPVTRVAFEVGYGSVAAFSRAFATHHGTPPQVWRSSRSRAGDADHRPDEARDRRGGGSEQQRRTYAGSVEERPACA